MGFSQWPLEKFIHYGTATQSPLILSYTDLGIGPHSWYAQCVCVEGEWCIPQTPTYKKARKFPKQICNKISKIIHNNYSKRQMYTHANRDKNIRIKRKGKENIRKNHIQFTYLIKGLDSLVSLVGRRTKKETGLKRDLESPP